MCMQTAVLCAFGRYERQYHEILTEMEDQQTEALATATKRLLESHRTSNGLVNAQNFLLRGVDEPLRIDARKAVVVEMAWSEGQAFECVLD